MHEDRSTERNKENEGEHSGETKSRQHVKRMHGQLPCKLDEKLADIKQSNRRIKHGDTNGETERKIVAAQN